MGSGRVGSGGVGWGRVGSGWVRVGSVGLDGGAAARVGRWVDGWVVGENRATNERKDGEIYVRTKKLDTTRK